MSSERSKRYTEVTVITAYLLDFCKNYHDIIPNDIYTNRDKYFSNKNDFDLTMLEIQKHVLEIHHLARTQKTELLFIEIRIEHFARLLDKLILGNFLLLERPLCRTLNYISQYAQEHNGKVIGYQVGQKFMSIECHPHIITTMKRLQEISKNIEIHFATLRTIASKFAGVNNYNDVRNKKRKTSEDCSSSDETKFTQQSDISPHVDKKMKLEENDDYIPL